MSTTRVNETRTYPAHPQPARDDVHSNQGDRPRFQNKRRDDFQDHPDGNNKKSRTREFGKRGPNPPLPTQSASTEDAIKLMERMNEVAKQSGFQNAQEMMAAQQQMAMMMHGGMAPLPQFQQQYPVRPIMPNMEPQRFDYFPPQHFPHYPAYEPSSQFQPDYRFVYIFFIVSLFILNLVFFLVVTIIAVSQGEEGRVARVVALAIRNGLQKEQLWRRPLCSHRSQRVLRRRLNLPVPSKQ
jgi:hypothetical protein